MPSKDKVINLFASMIEQAKHNEDKKDSAAPGNVPGNGHVIINGGSNTIHVYNRNKEHDID